MKKLLLLSLIFAALVFQSCKKISYNTDEGLVPIVFSRADITTKDILDYPAFEALVFGSIHSNSWKVIHSSAIQDLGLGQAGLIESYANGKIEFKNDPNDAFFAPEVFYPVEDETYIHIKALAPISQILGEMVGEIVTDVNAIINKEGVGPDKVIFKVDGKSDIIATEPTTEVPEAQGAVLHGCGKRGSDVLPSPIPLKFDHLLSKIDFWIAAESAPALAYWGDFVSITFLNGHSKFEYNLQAHTTSLLVVSPPAERERKDLLAINTALGNIEITQPIGTEKKACSVMVYPTTEDVGEGNDEWKILVNTQSGGTVRWQEVKFTFELERGKEYKVTLIFKENKKIEFLRVDKVKWTLWDQTGTPDTLPVL